MLSDELDKIIESLPPIRGYQTQFMKVEVLSDELYKIIESLSPIRGYQTQCMKKVYFYLRKDSIDSVLLTLPTGAGKTRTAVEIVIHALLRGKRVLEISHRDFLREQFQSYLSEKIVGVIQSGIEPDYRKPVQIATIQTLQRRELPEVDLVIIDEAHHASSKGYVDIINYYKGKGAKIIGLTATPIRLDGSSLSSLFSKIVIGINMSQLIGYGFLVNPTIFERYHPDLSGVKSSNGDYKSSELEKVVNTISSNGHVVSEYLRISKGKKSIVFAVNIKHGEELKKEFQKNGVHAKTLIGKTNSAERGIILREFKDGIIDVLINCNVLTEGFDLPSVEVVILVRPTKSLSLYLQMVGRCLRPLEGKTAIIIDLSGNREVHGLPTKDHDWEKIFLEGDKKKKKKKKDLSVKSCKNCFALVPSAKKQCPFCGFQFVLVYDRLHDLEILDYPVSEFIEEFKSLEYNEHERILRLISKVRNYNAGWVYHTLQNQKEESFYYNKLYKRIVQFELENFRRIDIYELKNEDFRLWLDGKVENYAV